MSDAKNEKVDESKENKDNGEIPIRPIRPYIEGTVQVALEKGLEELTRVRPANPLEFLGKFLLNYKG